MERDLINSKIEYELFGEPLPSDASGSYDGKKFYFYARWEDWNFVLSENSDVEPEDIFLLIDCDLNLIQKSENPYPSEWIEAFNNKSFILSGTYGSPRSCAASYMSKEDKMKIIRDCIDKYKNTKK